MPANTVPKELVRVYMAARRSTSAPPETPEDIRTQLGWTMLEAEREAKERSAK